MKKSVFLFSAFAMLLFASCQPEELGTVENKNAAPELSANKTAYSVGNGEGTLTVPIDANYASIKVAVASNASSWLSYKETKAETKAEMKTYKVVFSYKANPIATAREGKATITLAAKSIEVTVSQAAAVPVLSISLTSKAVNPRGDAFDLAVTVNDDYTVTSNVNWATFDKASGKVTATLNDTGSAREGQIVFASVADPTVKATLAITQKAANVDPELINILSIGDSFTEGPAQYLAAVLDTLGYKKVRLANIPFDGKTLAEVEALLKGTEKVAVHMIDKGVGKAVDSLAVDVLSPDDWDAIVLQPAFDFAGVYDAESVNKIVSFIRGYCEFTPIYWNMTWAYKTGATAAGFTAYGKDQKEMYDAIVNVATSIAENTEFAGVIPVGTLIQNIRTSFVEENVLEDDAKLSVNIGQLATAYLWAQVLTGKTITAVTYKPDLIYDKATIPAVTEAFANTLQTPFAVTPATQYPPFVMSIPEATAKAIIEESGDYSFEDYVAAPFVVMHWGFYNSQNGIYLTSSIFKGVDTSSGNIYKYAATKILPKASIPYGSLIVVLDGYGYRPEGWTALDAKNSTRPAVVTTKLVKVDDSWWGSFKYRAFNIYKTDGSKFSDEEMENVTTKFGIYIPKTALSDK